MREYMTGNEVLKKDIVLLLEKKKVFSFLSFYFFSNLIKYIYMYFTCRTKEGLIFFKVIFIYYYSTEVFKMWRENITCC